MPVIDFLRFVEINPILLYYYAFSTLLSVLLGSLFLRYLGQPRIWNYFFSVLVHVLSVFGVFSIVVTLYELYLRESGMNPFEMLIPFFTMLIAVFILSKRVDLAMITGYKRIGSYYIGVFVLISGMFLLDRLQWISIAQWSLSWVLVIVLVLLFLFQRVARWMESPDAHTDGPSV